MRKTVITLALSTAMFWGCKDRLPQQPEPPDPEPEVGTMMIAYTDVPASGSWSGQARVMVIGLDGAPAVELAKGYVIGQAGLNRVAFTRNDSVLVATWESGSWTITSIPIPEADPNIEFASVALSPDGKLLTFSTKETTETDRRIRRTYIAIVDAGVVGNPLPVGLAHETTPVFSRDGRKLAFYGVPVESSISSSEDVKLWIVNTDGSDHRSVADIERASPDAYMWLDFSPDGKKILFQDRDSTSIYLANTDGTGTPLLVSPMAMYPFWSRDGRKIIYYGAPGDILMKNADGTGTPQNLTNTPTQGDMFPQLSPDGKKILCTVFAGVPDEYPGMLKVFDIDNPSNIRTLSTSAYKGFWFRRTP